jgi:hypothetical protein
MDITIVIVMDITIDRAWFHGCTECILGLCRDPFG